MRGILPLVLGIAVLPAWPRSLSDAEVAARLKSAREEVEHGYLARAAATLDRLLAARPDEAAAISMLCDVRTALAEDLELDPVPHAEITAAFAKAALACRAAARIERAPAFWARRAWAHDALRAEDLGHLLPAYEAWAEAEPDDPRAVGGLAAVHRALGHADEAEAILGRALAGSAAFGQRVRFEYVCKATAQDAGVGAMLDEMLAGEQSSEGKTMLSVMRLHATDQRASLLTFLEAVERRALSDANAHKLWTCLAGENYFSRDERHAKPPPGMTLPERQRVVLAPYPVANRDEGKAVVVVRIEPDGRIGTAWLARASEPPFGDAALGSVVRWSYRPATWGGVAVPFPWVLTLDYRRPPKRRSPR